MKKILIIVGNISKTGGTERATVNLANILSGLNYSVSIISITGNKEEVLFYQLKNDISKLFLGLPILNSGFIKKFRWYYFLLKLLRRTIKENSYDIIIGTGHAINSLLPFVKSIKGTKTIACEHIAYDTLPFLSEMIRRITYRYLDGVVVLTKYAEDKFNYAKKVRRITNSLPFSVEKVSDVNEKQILAVGRISKVKGFDRLIEIAAILKEIHSDWKIKIVGEGELEAQLKETSIKLGVDSNVLFSPFTKDIQNEYCRSSLYALTSYSEAFPMVLLEAKSCGLPIVSYNCPEGPIDIIKEGVDGFLIQDGDAEAFSQALSKLIEDESLRIQMGRNAKIDSYNYSEEIIGEQWKNLINEIL